MKNALILHGIMGRAGGNWMQWLHDELTKRSYKVLMPQLPNPDHPDRNGWLGFLKNITKDIDFLQLTIVGHSLGVTSALDLIESENKVLKLLISVSGFSKPYGLELNEYFLKIKKIDMKKAGSLIKKVVVIHSDNDPYVAQWALKDLADSFGVDPIIIKNGGHINSGAGFTKFPFLLELLKEK